MKFTCFHYLYDLSTVVTSHTNQWFLAVFPTAWVAFRHQWYDLIAVLRLVFLVSYKKTLTEIDITYNGKKKIFSVKIVSILFGEVFMKKSSNKSLAALGLIAAGVLTYPGGENAASGDA